MSSELYEKTCEFLTNSSLKRISAVPVVYQAIVEEPWIDQNVLKELIQRAVNNVSRLYHPESQQYKKLIKIPQQFDIAYEGICGLCDMGVVKTNEGLLSSKEIMKNMMELKSKLAGHSSHLSNELYKTLKDVSYRDLTWKDPLASQVISDNSNIVRKLTVDEYNNFMKPALQMVPPTIPVVQEIGDVWKNPAFRPNFVNMQSEGTYVTDVVVPLLRSTLKNLPVGKINLLSTKEKLYELMFVECSRIICNDEKKENDKVKLWREMNDGMAYVHGGCKPDKNEFGVVGIQVAGRMLHLNVLIKDTDDINRLYHLRSVEIPMQPVDEEGVSQFVEALLILRNNLIVDISLLMNAPEAKSERQKKRSSTVSSDREDN
ncbi:10542_t:CDS:2 [Entrophospora sp. SA101]|nr:10542_t:CDS:2 [Entrophospora sp. SA101]